MGIFTTSLVPKMVAKVVTGQQSAEDATREGAAEMQQIVDRWNQAG